MKYELFEDIYVMIKDLDNTLTNRISDYSNSKHYQGERDAFRYYRSELWDIERTVRQLQRDVESTKQQDDEN